ncbi:MAG: hypothetical protein RSC05_11930 [Acinetobacter sp.]
MAVTYPIMAQMRLEIDTANTGTKFDWAGEGVTEITPSLNEDTSEYYYMNKSGAKTTVKEGMQRAFEVAGHRAVGDPLQDAIFEHTFKFGNNRTVKYRYYDSVTKKGETGTGEIIISDDGSGAANERMSFGYTLSVSGVPTIYTHTGA